MNLPFLRPRGRPIGVDTAEWRKALEQRIDQHAAVLSTLIEALDAMDGDCDLEVGGDDESWLGWIGNGPSQYQSIDDREIDESAVAK